MLKLLRYYLFIFVGLIQVSNAFGHVSIATENEKLETLLVYLDRYEKMDQFFMSLSYIMFDEAKTIVDQKKAQLYKDGSSYKYTMGDELTIYQNQKLNVSLYHKDSIIGVAGTSVQDAKLPNEIVEEDKLKYFDIKVSVENGREIFVLIAKRPLPIKQVKLIFSHSSKNIISAEIAYAEKIHENNKVYEPTLKIQYHELKTGVRYDADRDIDKVLKYDFEKKQCRLEEPFKSFKIIDLYKKNN